MKALIDYFIPHVDEGICMAFSGRVTPPRLRPSPVLWAPCTVLSKLTSSLTAVF